MNTRTIQYLLTGSLFALMIWAVSPTVKANFPFAPYHATYTVSWFGIPAGESSHRLSQHSNGHYRFETQTTPSAAMLPYHYQESTEFSWENNRFLPQRYDYNVKEGRRRKKGAVVFNWDTKQLCNHAMREPWQAELVDGIQDKLTQTFSLRYALKTGTNEFHYVVAEEDKIKPYHFSLIGEERLKTKLGTLQTVKIEHISRKGARTTLWLAKKLDFLPVKMTQTRQGKVVASGEIQSLELLCP